MYMDSPLVVLAMTTLVLMEVRSTISVTLPRICVVTVNEAPSYH